MRTTIARKVGLLLLLQTLGAIAALGLFWRHARDTEGHAWLLGTLVVVAAGDLLLFLLGFFLTWRFISRPVRQAVKAARRMRAGDFSAQVPIETSDELAVLAATLNDAAKTIGGLLGRLQDQVALDHAEQARTQEQFRQAQKMEAVGLLAGGVAHDFNNLLVAINGYADLILRRVPADDPERREVEEIRKAGERARTLTRRLLAFSRRQVLDPKVLDLNALVADLDAMLRRLIGEDVELVTEPYEGLGRVMADPGQVEQVVMNLVVNARDAMPGGGRITISTSNLTATPEVASAKRGLRPGEYVALSVADTGCGMGPEVMAHLFEPFFTTKGPGKGTGLGLASCYGIVKQSGGYIDVESAPGKGSTFRVLLPRVEAEAPTEDPKPVEAPAAAASGTILLVEDEAIVREVVREFLKLAGYAVVEASGPEEAIAKAASMDGALDLVISDVVMPQMTGPALVERLLAGRPGLRVLYISGYTGDAILRAGLDGARSDFLQKPFQPEELAAKVRALLARSPVPTA